MFGLEAGEPAQVLLVDEKRVIEPSIEHGWKSQGA